MDLTGLGDEDEEQEEALCASKLVAECTKPNAGSKEGNPKARPVATKKRSRARCVQPAACSTRHMDVGSEASFKSLLNKAQEDMAALPEAYENVSLLKAAPYRDSPFKGMKKEKLLKKFPELQPIADRCQRRSVRKLDPEARDAFEKGRDGASAVPRRNVSGHLFLPFFFSFSFVPQPHFSHPFPPSLLFSSVPPYRKQVKQTGADHLCTYGQFFRFVRIHETKDAPLSLEMLLSPRRVEAFAEFLVRIGKSPSTINNKMWHLCALYNHWTTLPTLQGHTHSINAVREMARRYGADAKARRIGGGGGRPDEHALRDGGAFFADEEERVTYNRWCLRRFALIGECYREKVLFFFVLRNRATNPPLPSIAHRNA